MTIPLYTGAAGFLARFEALRDRLPGDPHQRIAAADAFRRAGLPGATSGRREEAWKYTSLRPLADAAFDQPLPPDLDGTLLSRLPRIDAPRIVFLDGHFSEELSILPHVFPLFSRFADNPELDGLVCPDNHPLAALNTMLTEDGAVIHVPFGQDGGLVSLVNITTRSGVAAHPRHKLHLTQGAQLLLLEMSVGEGQYLHNPVIEAHVKSDATLTHVRLQDEAPAAFHLSTLYADIAERGTYDSFVLNLGARITRSEAHVRLGGAGGTVHLNGAQLLGSAQHSDITTVVRHAAPSCASRQTVKHVLAGHSQGVFQGRIEVARVAQKTDGYQMNQALLLSPDAEIDTKPELEIFADDVKCSHGATVGELDADQLFYLRSRGIPEGEARSLLVRAFLAEALDAVTNEMVRGVLDHAVEGWWEKQVA